MKKRVIYIVIFILSVSCGQKNSNTKATAIEENNAVSDSIFTLSDKSIKFLWRDDKYDEVLKDTFSTIFIDEEYCKTISEPERAALGYVATFIGNECWWDGEAKDDRSNLKCRILTALNLGYQCSDTHLGFLRQWFRNDSIALKELEHCPTTPYGATIQETFDEIILTVKGNEISVFFKAVGVNLRDEDSWEWSETDYFRLDKDNIKLIKKDESEVKQKHFGTDD